MKTKLRLILAILLMAMIALIAYIQSPAPDTPLTSNATEVSTPPPAPAPVPEPEPEIQWPTFVPGPFYENIQPVPNPYDMLALVNKNHQLPADFSPSDLRLVNVLDFYNGPATYIFMREVAATATEALFQAASEEANLALWARSGYRSYWAQQSAHNSLVSQLGQAEADRWSARPGHSEHQLGLAIDITAASVGGRITQDFSHTDEGAWLRENAHRFGFILSYPDGREEATGFAYEPWHFRFIGVEPATIIFENNLIFEEYLMERGLFTP